MYCVLIWRHCVMSELCKLLITRRTSFNRSARILSFITHHPYSHHLQCLRMNSASFGACFTQTIRKKNHFLLLRNMYELTEAIQQKKTCPSWSRNFWYRPLESEDILLTSVGDCAHLPSQVNAPIRVSPIEAFHEQLPISIDDSCVALNDPAWKVSDFFPKDLVEVPLHIIVSQPGKCD